MDEDGRPLTWMSGSKQTFDSLPHQVQNAFSIALDQARHGSRQVPGAKPLGKGVPKGLGIVELSKEFKGDAYRLVYTTKFAEMLPVLRVFIKQSKSGIATPLHEVRLIRHRYREAVRLDAKRKRRHGR